MRAYETTDCVDQALAQLDQALHDVEADRLDSVLAVLDHLTRLNDLLGSQQVPTEKFAETRARVDRAMISINALLKHLTEERDQVGAVLASLTPRLRDLKQSGRPFPERRLDVTN